MVLSMKFQYFPPTIRILSQTMYEIDYPYKLLFRTDSLLTHQFWHVFRGQI